MHRGKMKTCATRILQKVIWIHSLRNDLLPMQLNRSSLILAGPSFSQLHSIIIILLFVGPCILTCPVSLKSFIRDPKVQMILGAGYNSGLFFSLIDSSVQWMYIFYLIYVYICIFFINIFTCMLSFILLTLIYRRF